MKSELAQSVQSVVKNCILGTRINDVSWEVDGSKFTPQRGFHTDPKKQFRGGSCEQNKSLLRQNPMEKEGKKGSKTQFYLTAKDASFFQEGFD